MAKITTITNPLTGQPAQVDQLDHTAQEIDNAIQTVEKTTTTSKTVTVNAANLQSYLNSLPRLVTEKLTIKVSGTIDTAITIANFYGSGFIVISGADGFTLNNKIFILDCSAVVELYNIFAYAPASFDGNSNLLDIKRCSKVWVQDCTLTGNGLCEGVDIGLCSYVMLSKVAINSCSIAVLSATSSIVSIFSSTASDFSDNTVGAYTYRGGIIVFGDTGVPDLLGGASNVKSGGAIIKNGAFL